VRNVNGTARKQLFKAAALCGCFRMKRKSRPPDPDRILFLQFFNTPGNEITPGSDVVGKDFKNNRFGHDGSPYKNGAVHGE
jgi:hypothetical protein